VDGLGVLMGAADKMIGKVFANLLRAGSRRPIRKVTLLRAGCSSERAKKQKSSKHTCP
jgi:hypothetical protein